MIETLLVLITLIVLMFLLIAGMIRYVIKIEIENANLLSTISYYIPKLTGSVEALVEITKERNRVTKEASISSNEDTECPESDKPP